MKNHSFGEKNKHLPALFPKTPRRRALSPRPRGGRRGVRGDALVAHVASGERLGGILGCDEKSGKFDGFSKVFCFFEVF